VDSRRSIPLPVETPALAYLIGGQLNPHRNSKDANRDSYASLAILSGQLHSITNAFPFLEIC
jgi:hypothetical protein